MKAYFEKLGKINEAKSEDQQLTLQQQCDAELEIIESYHRAGLQFAYQFGQREEDITAAAESAKAAVRKKYADLELQQINESEEKKREARERLGIDTMTEYERQKQMLDEALKNQYISQEEYEKKVQKLKRESYMKQAQYYTSLFSNAFTALQDAEMAQVDAKYDAQIEAARQAGEDTTELENKKAQEKLAIEKKYADVNFAIKASQIIADTATSIMKAYADLGPIAGSVAAALMGITGAAQLAAANAEREKVKKMRSPKLGQKWWAQNLAICRDTNCPAVLTENLFQDNESDYKYLLSDEGRETIINLHVSGIIQAKDTNKELSHSKEKFDSTAYYRSIVDSLRRIKKDSINNTIYIEKELSLWDRAKIKFGGLAFIIVAAVIIYLAWFVKRSP